MTHSSVGAVLVSSLLLAACAGTTATNEGSQSTQAELTGADGGSARAPGRHHGPPPEAFDACVGKAEGAACTVKFGDQSISGTCVAHPGGAPDQRIVCRPDKAPDGHPHGPHGPPPEAIFTACGGKASGDACSVTLGDQTRGGVCREPPPGVQETRLGCAPAGPPPHAPPDGVPPMH